MNGIGPVGSGKKVDHACVAVGSPAPSVHLLPAGEGNSDVARQARTGMFCEGHGRFCFLGARPLRLCARGATGDSSLRKLCTSSGAPVEKLFQKTTCSWPMSMQTQPMVPTPLTEAVHRFSLRIRRNAPARGSTDLAGRPRSDRHAEPETERTKPSPGPGNEALLTTTAVAGTMEERRTSTC